MEFLTKERTRTTWTVQTVSLLGSKVDPGMAHCIGIAAKQLSCCVQTI